MSLGDISTTRAGQPGRLRRWIQAKPFYKINRCTRSVDRLGVVTEAEFSV